MSYCPQCRTPLQPGARFCANCGHVLATPPPAYGAPPAAGPAGWGSPAGAPPPQHPAPMPVPMAPPPAPAPAAGGGTGMKVLGGCGVAGCLGVALAGVALVGLIFLVVALGSSDSSAGPSAGRSGELPGDGSLRSLVRSNVGGFTLISTAPVTQLGDRLSPGVVDSLGAFYRAPDGTQLVQILLVYPSQSVAQARMQAVFEVALTTLQPGQKITRGQVKNSSGEEIGTSLAITGGSVDHVYWSNGKLLTFASAPSPNAVDYHDASPY